MASVRPCHFATAVGALVGAGCALFYFGLTVDDAWIPLRYAHSLLERGEWAFNPGERINALTSTTHFLLLVALQWTTGEALVLNKIVMGALVLLSGGMLAARLRWQPEAVALVAGLLVASPFVWVWAVGGLETILLLFLVSVFVSLSPRIDDRRAFLVFNVLAGLMFLTRYDSIVVVLPLLFGAWWQTYRQRGMSRWLLAGIGLSALLPLLWMAFSLTYFHDIFPTSYYAKRSRHVTWYKVGYTLQFFVMSGVVPFLLVAVANIGRHRRFGELRQYLSSRLPVVAAAALLFAYGTLHSTVHMMFGYRLFVPYLPVLIVVVAELLAVGARTGSAARPARWSVAVPCLLAVVFVGFQLAQSVVVYQRGLSGIGWAGEYRQQSVRTYQHGFVSAMTQGCEDLKRHAGQRAEFTTRAPRLLTFAEGYIPFCFPELYTFGQLVSMRRPTPPAYSAAADYIYVLYPRHGSIEEQLAYPPERYERVSSYTVEFDGRQEAFIIFFNPQPAQVEMSRFVR